MERKKRVLMFLVPRASGGGAEKVIVSLASRLAEEHKVFLVTTVREDGVEKYPISEKVTYLNVYHWEEPNLTENQEKTQEIILLSVATPKLPDTAHTAIRRALGKIAGVFPAKIVEPIKTQVQETDISFQIQTVRRMKKAFGVDCAISFLNSANYINVMSCIGEKTIVSIRSYPESRYAPADNWTEEGKRRITVVCERADWVVAVAKETADCVSDVYGVPAEKMRVIYNYVDREDIAARCQRPLEDEALQNAVENAAFVFVSPGRLTEKKGQWHLIRAFREVVRQHPGALLVIPGREGKGKENVAEYLRQLIRMNGLEDTVLLPGFCKNPYALLSRCDAFVSASFNEGFPNAMVEAMALGLPVISTDCRSGPREILAPTTDCHQKADNVDYAEFGILTPECSGNKQMKEPPEKEELMLSNAMLRLMKDGELLSAYREKSLERVRHFSKDDTIMAWKQLIEGENLQK